jgi:hypothetical protein
MSLAFSVAVRGHSASRAIASREAVLFLGQHLGFVFELSVQSLELPPRVMESSPELSDGVQDAQGGSYRPGSDGPRVHATSSI